MTARGGAPDRAFGTGDRRRNTRSHMAILNATTALLCEVGYSQLTIEGVAARAGVGKATVYRWWPSKGSLAIDAVSRSLSQPTSHATGDIRKDMLVVIERTIDVLARSPEGATLTALTADLVNDPALAQQFRDQILQPGRAAVRELIRDAIDGGQLPANLDSELMMDIYVGAVFYRVLVSAEPVTDALAEQLVSLIIDGTHPTKPVIGVPGAATSR